jgi:GTP pyrophosphokinase
MDVYAPLAERLGIGFLKGELEDLAFPYVYPKEYAWTLKVAQPRLKHAAKVLENVRKIVLEALSIGPYKDYKVILRQKHWYSLYLKLMREDHNRDIEKIHDLMALRIIVDSVEECYQALGMIHRLFRPVTSLGVRDFVANPKPNGYKSIHTNVFAPDGGILEVQIRTKEMDELADYGLAAHWHYGEMKSKGANDLVLERGTIPGKKLSWVKELVEWQKEITDHEEYLRALKFDALQHRQLVFSPRGDVFDLPKGSTPVDYAYAVHTDLGNRIGQARVNGKLMPLSHKLGNGDVVEILPDKRRKKPSQNWLDFVVTTHARKSIRRWG